MAKISEYTTYNTNIPSGGTEAKFKATGKAPVSGKYTAGGDQETRSATLADMMTEQVQVDWETAESSAKSYIKNIPACIGKGIKPGNNIQITDSDGWYVIEYTGGGGGGGSGSGS